MKDLILAARIDALERHLQPPEAPQTWPETFPQAHVSDRIWEDLTREMTRERRTRANELSDLRERLDDARTRKDLEALWRDYAEVYNASQDIFRESREIMGGLAFREKNSDDARLCQIAEDIVLDCTRNAGTIPSLPVPGHEVVSRTLARVVRMRLPEWTLWTLPLVAREYGKVVLDEFTAVAEFVEAQHAAFAAEAGSSGDAALELAKYDLRSLLADAFAAYTMGPAYGYAAVTLALNPADRTLASRLRAEVICAVLEQDASRDRRSPFAAEVKYLRNEWRTLQRRIGMPERLGKPAIIGDLLDAIAPDVYELRYPVRAKGVLGRPGEHGYVVARRWAEEWLAAIDHELPTPSSASAASSIRDVLNAAWLARIEVSKPNSGGNGDGGLVPEPGREEEIVQRIEKAALALCGTVMELHAKPAGAAGPTRTDGGPG